MKRLLFLRKLFLAILLFAPLAVMAQVTIGSTTLAPEKAALLDLKTHAPNGNNATTDKGGLLLPRVELVDVLSLEPFIDDGIVTTTDKEVHAGLTVYNLTHDEPAGLVPGFYYWDGETWEKVLTEIPSNGVSMRNLLPPDCMSLSITNLLDNTGRDMDFGPIIAPEDGAYAFSFRLYGSVGSITGLNQRCVYYLKAYVNGVLDDSAEINLYTTLASGANTHTYSVTLAVNASAGDTITFRFAHLSTLPRAWTLVTQAAGSVAANRTSMVWWKL